MFSSKTVQKLDTCNSFKTLLSRIPHSKLENEKIFQKILLFLFLGGVNTDIFWGVNYSTGGVLVVLK